MVGDNIVFQKECSSSYAAEGPTNVQQGDEFVPKIVPGLVTELVDIFLHILKKKNRHISINLADL